MKEAVYACFTGLLEVNGELLVPPSMSFTELSQAVSAVARPQQLWRSDLQIGSRIADERCGPPLHLDFYCVSGLVHNLRIPLGLGTKKTNYARYNVALQLMLQSLCCGVSRCMEAFSPEASAADQVRQMLFPLHLSSFTHISRGSDKPVLPG